MRIRGTDGLLSGLIIAPMDAGPNDLPKPNLVWGDDGAVLIEWTSGRRRIGINIEAIAAESSWYFVSLDPSSASSASGPLSELDALNLFERLRGR